MNMRTTLTRIAATTVAGLVIFGCGTGPATTAAPTPTGTPSPTASPVMTSPGPSATPRPSPSAPIASGGFTTPVPLPAGAEWTSISWRQLEPNDPLADVRSMLRWRNGYVAVGRSGVGSTPVWASSDGASWTPLGGEVFGPSALVLGIGESAVGLVALTVEQSQVLPGSWQPGTPVRAWTSPDGATWTSRPGPAIELPEDPPLVAAGPAGLVIATRAQSPEEAGQVAFSHDGIAWEPLPADTLPLGFFMDALSVLPSGFVAIGNGSAAEGSPATALTSVDGRTWTSHTIEESTPTAERVVSRLAGGSAGVIAMGEQYAVAPEGQTGSAASIAIWWSSLDGRAWASQAHYPPLGPQLGPDAQECYDACPDGDLVGDGERLLAHRGGPGGAAWTSFDGRSWTSLAMTSDPIAGSDRPTTMIVLPVGLLWIQSDSDEGDERAWFGTP